MLIMMREVMLMRAHYWAGRMETTRTTVALPTRLLERVNAAVDSGAVPNRNIAIADALEAYLDDIERQEIDPAKSYVVGARILLGEQVLFASTAGVPVITQGAPTADVVVNIPPAQ